LWRPDGRPAAILRRTSLAHPSCSGTRKTTVSPHAAGQVERIGRVLAARSSRTRGADRGGTGSGRLLKGCAADRIGGSRCLVPCEVMDGLPGGTVTFLFTDVEASTRLHEERADAPAVLAAHLVALGEVVTRHGGAVFARGGDGLAAAFRTAAAAVGAALDGQVAMVSLPVRVRMGLHTGEADPIGGSYQSPVVNRAARVMAVAHGGQVVASEATVALLGSGPSDRVLRDLGRHRLRDVSELMWLFQVDGPGSRAAFPPLRSLNRIVGNLPSPVSSFVGRDEEVRLLVAAVRSDLLVTVTGPGGVGKTRLALQAASEVASSFLGGVWFVELAPVGDPGAVVSAVASAMELRVQGAAAVDAVVEQLSTGSSLLVLDNCEHVVDAVAELVDAVVRKTPGVRVVVTSREAIGVGGERVVPLRPMATDTAVALFTERALALDPSFDLGSDRPAAWKLVDKLDGIPLAIELAAARTTTMSVTELLERLDHRLQLLAGGRRRAIERHATMRATLDWSYELLVEDEQRLARHLSVFPASFTVTAVEGIGGAIGLDRIEEVPDVLDALVRKSLVQSLPVHRHRRRFRLLETVRTYLIERLVDAGETEALGRAHTDWILGCYQRMGVTDALANHTVEELHELIDLRHDVRAAIDWCLANGEPARAVRLAAPNGRIASTVHDAVEWADVVLATDGGLDGRDRFALHVVAAEGKMLHAVHPSAAYPDIEAAATISWADDVQRIGLRRVLALRTWFRDGNPDAIAAHASAEEAAHPADQAYDHYNAALLLSLADRDPEPHWRRGDELAAKSGRHMAGRPLAVAAVARRRARHGRPDAVPLFLDAIAEVRTLPIGPIRSIVAGLAAGGLASLDPAAARDVLLELIDPDLSDMVSPSDIVRAAIGMVLYLNVVDRNEDACDILGRTISLPGASRLISVFAPEIDTDVPVVAGTHYELLERMRALLLPSVEHPQA
jgi:predicted ATPase/class 3 adenylate cyclase